MEIVQIRDKKFKKFIPEQEILSSIREIGEEINEI
jgi:hypothetical protein